MCHHTRWCALTFKFQLELPWNFAPFHPSPAAGAIPEDGKRPLAGLFSVALVVAQQLSSFLLLSLVERPAVNGLAAL